MKTFNELFDCLNGKHSSQHIKKRNPNLAPYTSPNDSRFQKLLNILDYVEDWKKEVASSGIKKKDQSALLLSHQTMDGIEITIRGFIGVCKYLLTPVEEGGAGTKFIMAGTFSQDCLEMYFSKQRAACGGNRNPTEDQYLRNVASLHLQRNLKMKRKNANVKDASGNTESIDDFAPLKKRPKTAKRQLLPHHHSEEVILEEGESSFSN